MLDRVNKAQMNSQEIRPLLKWPGGKRVLADRIVPYLKSDGGTYYEPFCGGAAVYLKLQPPAAVLGDLNPEVTNCYRQVQLNPGRVAAALKRLSNSEAEYYRVRAMRPRNDVQKAARLIYLVSLSFNGIYRQNLNGDFNVPYGYKSNFELPNEAALMRFSKSLARVSIQEGDFESTTRGAKRGDVVYFDPPYTVAHSNNGFVKYNARIFSWDDQRRLSLYARKLAAQGCRVVISNASHESIDELYLGFARKSLQRSSVIAASSEKRSVITERIYIL